MTEIEKALGRAAHADADQAAAVASDALVAEAEAEGLVDVAYARAESPFGDLLLAATPRGLVRINYLSMESESAALVGLAEKVSPRVLEAPARLDGPRRELAEYFAGSRRSFELPLDWRLTGGFSRRVLRATAAIPYGSTASYAKVAQRAGSARAYRAAGNALHHNPLPVVVPCHRVLQTNGSLGGYAGGLEVKELLLELERGGGVTADEVR